MEAGSGRSRRCFEWEGAEGLREGWGNTKQRRREVYVGTGYWLRERVQEVEGRTEERLQRNSVPSVDGEFCLDL